MYTSAQLHSLAGPTWHWDPAWHQLLNGRRVPRQGGAKVAENNALGAASPPKRMNYALANARMPFIRMRYPTHNNTTRCRTWGTIRRALHDDIDRDQATWMDQGSVTHQGRQLAQQLELKERGGVGVHTKQPRCTGRVRGRNTDGTQNLTRQ